MWGTFYGYVQQFLEPFRQKLRSPFKRQREVFSDSGFESSESPPKKRKVLYDITETGSNAQKENYSPSNMQVEELQFITTSSPNMIEVKENSDLRRLRLLKMSPRKRSYKAPAHCKPPAKTSTKVVLRDDVIFVGTIPKQQKNQNSPIVEVDLTIPEPKKFFFRNIQEKRKPPQVIRSDSRNNFTTPEIMGHMEYSQVLGNFIKATSQRSEERRKNRALPVETKPVAVVDLTDDDTFIRPPSKSLTSLVSDHFSTLSKLPDGIERKKRPVARHQVHKEPQIRRNRGHFIDLTSSVVEETTKVIQNYAHSSVIHLDDSDDDLVVSVKDKEARELSEERINSLERSFQKWNFTSTDWLNEITSEYKRKLGVLEEERRSAEKITGELHGINQKNITKCIEERLQRHLLFIEDITATRSEAIEEGLPTLTPEMKAIVRDALRPHPEDEILVENFSYQIKRRDLKTLAGLNWLNDEVINFYMTLLIERGKEGKYPSIYAFNTFFYPKLMKQGHAGLKRWTRKVDIFSHSMIIVPVHLGMHWCLASVHLEDKVINYYDSMGHSNSECLEALLEYLVDEYKDKKKDVFDTSDWKLMNAKEIPKQKNGSDCGMFACTFAEYICRRAPFLFSQSDMPYFRHKMVYEILTSSLMIK